MAGSSQTSSDELITDINVVPLVDIILVVLIIFMLSATALTRKAIGVELPKAATGEAAENVTLALALDRDGALFLDGAPIARDALGPALDAAVKKNHEAQAIIAADARRSHGEVVQLIDFIRAHGVHKFALNVDPAEEARP
ncbi:MAG: biopolymer transporter ExbD [Myxococcaceae bacterium]|nr:biopolymer transporter ExbD [Myxococcaceae bacterium]